MLKRMTATIASALLIAGPANAQSAKPQSGTYVVEPNHTMIVFAVNHLGFTTYYGRFTGASGSLTLNAASPGASRVDISVPVVGDITPSAKLNEEIAGPMLLDAGKFPTMTFRSTRIMMTGPRTADVFGNLTLHGVTRPVVLGATLHGFGPHPREKKTVVGFDATGHINRSEFGVSYGVPVVSDNIDLTLSAEFDLVPS